MKCFICDKNRYDAMLLKLPLEISFLSSHLHFIGNANPNEYICLPCIGYQWDEAQEDESA